MKAIGISVFVALLIIGGSIVLTQNGGGSGGEDVPENNVTIVDGKQIITIRARGGYQPRRSVAKAGLPTILRFDTSGTFDCSSSVIVPSLKISEQLPLTGSTDVAIGVATLGVLQGSCGMGMYPFSVDFQDEG